MSTTIDSKVVEMRFDNKHFESGVSSTMSMLDRLKEKLGFKGATRGLEEVSAAASRVDFTPMGNSVETVGLKFNALWTVADQVLRNITNSAMTTGKQLINSLTIDQLTAGWGKYEDKTASVQTIMNATGLSIDEVNGYLEKLMWFSDETSYGFTDMTAALGQMTSSGGDINKLIPLITGVANATAYAGKGAGEFSRAMYNLNQSYGAGYLQLMDWKSLELAGIGSKQLKETFISVAEEMGKIEKGSINIANFSQTLKDKWADTEVMEAAFGRFGEFSDAVHKLVNGDISEFSQEIQDLYNAGEIETASDAIEVLSEHYDEIGVTAFKSAQEAKSFTDAIDATKDAVSSGWMKTFEIIFGNYEQAKVVWTDLCGVLWDVFASGSETRNALLSAALNFVEPWNSIMEKLQGGPLGKIAEVAESVKNVTQSLEHYQDVVSKVWRGDFNNVGDTPDRYDLLEKAGYDHRVVQDLVNLGKDHTLTMEDVEASHAKFGLTMDKTTESMEGTAEATEEMSVAIESLSDEELLNAGLTLEEIELYRDLEAEAKRTGRTISEVAEEMSTNDGRTLLLDGFKNAGSALLGIFYALKDAFAEIFPAPSVVQLYNMIKAFNQFTEHLRLTDKETGELNETGQKIQRTFQGIFAVLDIALTIIGGPVKVLTKLLMQFLGAFGLSALDVTAVIGDMLVGVRDFIDSALDFTSIFEKMVQPIKNAYEAFRKWIESLKESENLPADIAKGIASGFGKAFEAIKNFFKKIPEYFSNGFDSLVDSPITGFVDKIRSGLSVAVQTIAILGDMIREKITRILSSSEFAGISADSIAGLVNGFKDGASNVWNAAVEMAKNLVQKVKDFLGIESPSKVFYAIGGFLIAGLIAGLQNGIPDSLGAVKDVFQPMLDWIRGIDLGAVIASVIGIGTTITGYKAVGALETLASPLEGLGELFSGVGTVLTKSARSISKVIKSTTKVVKSFAKVIKGFANVLNGVSFKMKTEGIMNLGKTLLMLVAAIAILTFFKPAELWNAVAVVAVLAVLLVGLAFAMDKLGGATASIGKDGLDIKGLSSGLAGIGIALLLLAITVKMIGSLDSEQAKQGFLGLAGLVIAMGAVIAVFGLLVKGESAANIDKFGKTMTKLAIALLLMTLVVKILGGMDRSALIQGSIAMLVFGGMIVGLIAATKLISGSKNVDTIGGTLLKIALAIGVMAIVAKMLGELDPEVLLQGSIAMVVFGGMIVGLMAATKLISGSKNVDKIGGTLLKIALAIGVMALVAKVVGGMDAAALTKGCIGIAAFGGIIVGLMAATRLVSGSKNIDKIGKTIISISAAIAIMALTAFLLSAISWEGFAKGTIMIAAFGGIVIGLMAATKLVGKDADKIGKTILTIAAAIGILALIAVLLGFVSTEHLAKGILAVAALSAIMAGLIAVTYLAKNCLGNLIVITVAIATIAAAVYLLSTVDPTGLTAATLAMSIVLATFGFVVAMTGLAKNAIGSLIVITIAVAAIGGVLYLLSSLPVESVMGSAAGLSVLLLAMSAACLIISHIPVAAAVQGALGLAAFIGIMAGVLLALGGLSMIPGFNDLIAGGGNTLALIGEALGKFVGSIIAGFAGAVLTILPQLGLALSGFMAGAQPFIMGAKMVDASVLEGVGILSAAILALSVADFIAGILTLGGVGLVALGLELSAFMLAAMPFINEAAKITPEMMAGVKALAETLLILTAADLLNGLNLFGGASLAEFASQLPLLGIGLSMFAASLGTFSDEQLATVNCAAEAIKKLAQASSEIPNAGGLLGMLVGENDLGTFAAQFPILGTGLRMFLDNVGTFTEEQVATVNCAAEAIKSLATAASEIPNSGGWIGAIVGENDLGTFADQFPSLGTGLAGFLANVGTFTEEQVATVNCAANAVKTLASVASEIPNEGGWLSKIFGDNSLGTFADHFPKLGDGLAGFVSNLGTFDTAQVSTINSGIRAIRTIAELSTLDLAGLKNNISGFGDKLPAFGENLSEFCSNMPSPDSVTSAVTGLNAMMTAAKAIASFNSDPLATFAENLSKIGKDAVNKFVEAFTSVSAKTDLNNAAKTLGDKVVSGAKSKYQAMKSAGKYLVEGFGDGITDKTWYAEAKAKAMAKAAEKAAKRALDVNSPSKVFRAIGYSVPEGFANGIDRMTRMVTGSSTNMATSAIDTVKNSISRISNMVSSDIDAQPTIRPVMDLSDVRAGVNTMSGMLDMDSSVGVAAHIGAISSMMAGRSQNGGNSDVVSELAKLRKDIGNMSNTTYQVNGVTYDDGSNISNAVQSIVRAARIERRV